MTQTYKIDYKETVFGRIEIEAENDLQAEEMFFEMSSENLLKKSNTKYKQSSREIRFVDIGGYFDSMTAEEWDDYKNGRIKIFNTMKSLSPEHT